MREWTAMQAQERFQLEATSGDSLPSLRQRKRWGGTMPFVECLIALQANNSPSHPGNSPGAMYFVIALLAMMVGLIAWIFIRASARRAKRWNRVAQCRRCRTAARSSFTRPAAQTF